MKQRRALKLPSQSKSCNLLEQTWANPKVGPNEEPKFSATAWRESVGSKSFQASEDLPSSVAGTEQQKFDETGEDEARDTEETSASGDSDAVAAVAVQTQRQRRAEKLRQPRGAMWFVPGETDTSRSKTEKAKSVSNLSQDTERTEDDRLEREEAVEAVNEVIRESDDPWQTLEDDRQLAWEIAKSEEPLDVWDQAPDANFKALAWEELEKSEMELSKLKEELLQDELEEEPLTPLTHTESELPIEALRQEIIERVRQHRATILVGATGCGKSTRLPQYIMEEHGSKVLVTQPRRVAAVEIAKRVAAERGERVGKNVGYRISGETVAGNGKLQFATIGDAKLCLLVSADLEPLLFNNLNNLLILTVSIYYNV